MFELMEKTRDKKGFTLMEMLIVVAIIAILVAIIIPVFSSQLEKARTAADAANIRSAYAMAQACTLIGESPAGTAGTGPYYLQKDGDFLASGADNYLTQGSGDEDDCPAYGQAWTSGKTVRLVKTGDSWNVKVGS